MGQFACVYNAVMIIFYFSERIFMKTLRLLICVTICELAGYVGAVFTTGSVNTWYTTLVKPSFNPPNWVFAPVWSTLYLLMGIALFLVWTKSSEVPSTRKAISVFALQLALNVSWSAVFFGLRFIAGAMGIIIVLWCSILWTIVVFRKVSAAAAWLLLPYIIWVSFAVVLNGALVYLN